MNELFQFEKEYRVKMSDLEINLHTNNVRCLHWINDTCNLDFIMKNFPKSVEINYLSESLFNEEILIKTSTGINVGDFYNHSVFRKKIISK